MNELEMILFDLNTEVECFACEAYCRMYKMVARHDCSFRRFVMHYFKID